MKKFFTFLCSVICSAFLFAEIKVISPVSGNWANKQLLMIDMEDDADYFYSLNGEDPELAGFAYDGPVLLDVTGDITLKIAKGFEAEERAEVKFSVAPSYPDADEERLFIYTFFDTGLLNYFSGSQINIPKTFRYSFEEIPENFNPGKTLSYSSKCSVSRFLPCTVTDGKKYWHFVIRANPNATGSFSRRDLPFTIKNWNTIIFDDHDLLFRVDNEYWTLPDSSRILDRSERHIIYWQSLDYQIGNPVEFYELPPMPSLRQERNVDGSVSFFLDGDDSYSMTISNKDSSFYELYTELCADTFVGDYLEDSVEIAVYSDSVYQGVLHGRYEIDRRLPSYPVFTASSSGFHARGAVSLNVKTTGTSDLYVAISEPMVLDSADYDADSAVFKSVVPVEFSKVKNNSDFILSSNSDKPVYYKVLAYSESGKQKSDVSEYSVIIDSYSFYFDAKADPSVADGSKDTPFTDFKDALSVMKDVRSVNIYVKGRLPMPQGKTEIDFNCEFIGVDNASIEFPANSSLSVIGSTLQFTGCRVTNDSSSSRSAASLIKLESAVLSLNNSEVYFAGGRNAAFTDALNSVVMLNDSVVTVTAQVYASFISALSSRVTLRNTRVAVVADTAICLSLRDSKCLSDYSSFRVTGTLGRIAEFFNTEGTLTNNTFSADLKRVSGSVQPVYKDDQSSVKENSNRTQGF